MQNLIPYLIRGFVRQPTGFTMSCIFKPLFVVTSKCYVRCYVMFNNDRSEPISIAQNLTNHFVLF